MEFAASLRHAIVFIYRNYYDNQLDIYEEFAQH
jgi:hypothetical protein